MRHRPAALPPPPYGLTSTRKVRGALLWPSACRMAAHAERACSAEAQG